MRVLNKSPALVLDTFVAAITEDKAEHTSYLDNVHLFGNRCSYSLNTLMLFFVKVSHDDGLTHHKLEVTLSRPLHSCCVLISQYYLLPTCTPRFVWTAIKNQPIGTAGRRAPAPGARLARPANHSPRNQSTGTHRVNIRASSGLEEGGTTRACQGERERERDREI